MLINEINKKSFEIERKETINVIQVYYYLNV